jgi:hypothetical protein
MELRTSVVDRILEALAPSLAAEIERIVAETRQNLEADFQKRLQDAIREAEQAVRKVAELEMDRALADTRNAVRQQVTAELQARFKSELEEATSQIKSTLEDEFNQASSDWASERKQLQEQLREWQTFSNAQLQLNEANSQPEILARFLRLSEPFATAVAVYIAKPDGLALWKCRGQGPFPETISQQIADSEFFFRPVVVRGKTVAAVCAAQPYRAEALGFLTGSMERAIEMFGLKLRAPVQAKTSPETVRPRTASAPVSQMEPAGQSSQAVVAAQAGPLGDEERLHADARKIARLLVSEIKLYHEQEVKEGRMHSDLYQRLRREIEHGRDSYNQRVPRTLTATRDYFHEELVRILTDNDPSCLGDAYPGPAK